MEDNTLKKIKKDNKKGLTTIYKIILPIYSILVLFVIISMFHAIIDGVEDIFAYLFFVCIVIHPILLVFTMKDSKFPLVWLLIWLCVMGLFCILWITWPYISTTINSSPCDIVEYSPNDKYHISDRPCG